MEGVRMAGTLETIYIYIMIMATLFAFEYSCKSRYALAIKNWLLEIE